MQSEFKIVYQTTIHLLLLQAVYLLHSGGSIPLIHAAHERIAQQEDVPRYDVQSYNDLLDQAEREINAKGGR